MASQFDLETPLGTCYLAAEELSALLELIGPELAGGAISSEFFAARRIRKLAVPLPISLADLTSRRARSFGITAEIGSIVPYEAPQTWAARLQEAGAKGLIYWLRHDPSRSQGFALFGPGGENKRWRGGREKPISRRLVHQLEAECGIEVLPIPTARSLRILRAPSGE